MSLIRLLGLTLLLSLSSLALAGVDGDGVPDNIDAFLNDPAAPMVMESLTNGTMVNQLLIQRLITRLRLSKTMITMLLMMRMMRTR